MRALEFKDFADTSGEEKVIAIAFSIVLSLNSPTLLI